MSLRTRIVYRCRQFLGMVWPPPPDPAALTLLRAHVPGPLRPLLDRLHPGDLAHLLRLIGAIAAEPGIDEEMRHALLDLAAVHDLGKAVLQPSLFERVAKVLLPLPRHGHARLGARLLRRTGAPAMLCRRVAHHHDRSPADPLLARFQAFDDRC